MASFASGDPDTIAAHVSDGFVNDQVTALGDGCVGRDAYRSRLPELLGLLEGMAYDIEGLLVGRGPAATATAVVAYRLTATTDGRPVDLRGVMWIEVDGDRIARRTDYWDSLTFLRQTGPTAGGH